MISLLNPISNIQFTSTPTAQLPQRKKSITFKSGLLNDY